MVVQISQALDQKQERVAKSTKKEKYESEIERRNRHTHRTLVTVKEKEHKNKHDLLFRTMDGDRYATMTAWSSTWHRDTPSNN